MDIHGELAALGISPSFVVRECYSESDRGHKERTTYYWVGYRDGKEAWGHSTHYEKWPNPDDEPGHWGHLPSNEDKLTWLKTVAAFPFPPYR